MLGANDYLGLASHPQVVGAAKRALDRFGCGTAMNPLLCTTRILEGLAEEIAAFSGMQAATLFGSGTAANIAALTVLRGARGLVASDRLNHASIIDACLTDGIFSMEGTAAPLSDLSAITRRLGAMLVVDEAWAD
jgi:8-amino-7-oxononanoate synthase